LVVVIDDDESVRISVASLLRSVGFRVGAFASAESFLASATVEEAAALVIDLQLEGMNGLDLVGCLADRGRSLPFVVITGLDTEESRTLGMRAGAKGFFKKPLVPNQLLQALSAMLRRAATS
jgi:FixJ family two-component response regulator